MDSDPERKRSWDQDSTFWILIGTGVILIVFFICGIIVLGIAAMAWLGLSF